MNRIATFLKVIATLIYICGAIVGLVASNFGSWDYSFGTMMLWWSGTIVVGTLLLGFGTVISLLNDINNKLSDIQRNQK